MICRANGVPTAWLLAAFLRVRPPRPTHVRCAGSGPFAECGRVSPSTEVLNDALAAYLAVSVGRDVSRGDARHLAVRAQRSA